MKNPWAWRDVDSWLRLRRRTGKKRWGREKAFRRKLFRDAIGHHLFNAVCVEMLARPDTRILVGQLEYAAWRTLAEPGVSVRDAVTRGVTSVGLGSL